MAGNSNFEVKGEESAVRSSQNPAHFSSMLFYLKRTITSMKDDGSLPCPAYLRGESFKKEVPKTPGEGAH